MFARQPKFVVLLLTAYMLTLSIASAQTSKMSARKRAVKQEEPAPALQPPLPPPDTEEMPVEEVQDEAAPEVDQAEQPGQPEEQQAPNGQQQVKTPEQLLQELQRQQQQQQQQGAPQGFPQNQPQPQPQPQPQQNPPQ